MTEVTHIVYSRFFLTEHFENDKFPDSKKRLWRLLTLVRHKPRMPVIGEPTIHLGI